MIIFDRVKNQSDQFVGCAGLDCEFVGELGTSNVLVTQTFVSK